MDSWRLLSTAMNFLQSSSKVSVTEVWGILAEDALCDYNEPTNFLAKKLPILFESVVKTYKWYSPFRVSLLGTSKVVWTRETFAWISSQCQGFFHFYSKFFIGQTLSPLPCNQIPFCLARPKSVPTHVGLYWCCQPAEMVAVKLFFSAENAPDTLQDNLPDQPLILLSN